MNSQPYFPDLSGTSKNLKRKSKILKLAAQPKLDKGIKSWALEDRPREKLIIKGATHLNNSELLAILLGNGTKKMSAIDLARNILNGGNNNWKVLRRQSIKQLMAINGVGQAKASIIMAAFEIGKRTMMSTLENRITITSSKDAYLQIAPQLEDLKHEEFWILLLDTSKKMITKIKIGEGVINMVLVDPKKIISSVTKHGTVHSVILVHNHPSGQVIPSLQDQKLTDKLKTLLLLIDVKVIDHLIIGASDYFSFSDSGTLDQ